MSSCLQSWNPATRPDLPADTILLGEAASPIVSVTVSDLTGKTVWSQLCHPFGNLIPVALNNKLAPGIYFIRLVDNGQTQAGKLQIR